MVVVFRNSYEITVNVNGIRYTYEIDNGYRAAKIVENMMPSQGLRYLDKNGSYRSSY